MEWWSFGVMMSVRFFVESALSVVMRFFAALRITGTDFNMSGGSKVRHPE